MDVTAYILPELLVLIPVLNLIGVAIKRSEVADELIPVILGAFGMLMAILYELATLDAGGSVAMALFTGMVQGIFCAAGAVFLYETQKDLRRLQA